MKKKITLLAVIAIVFASCGPKRLGCYNRRCLVEVEKQKSAIPQEQKTKELS